MARNTNGSGFSLKDELFNKKKVVWLAAHFKAADASFDDKAFVSAVMKKLTKLELKERIVWIAKVLEDQLDKDFKVAAKQIKSALPNELDPAKTDDDFGDFIIAPLGEFVVRNGLSKKNLKVSLSTLKELTKRFSMEDAIRYFINEFPDETMAELRKWVNDKNYHVRRLVSEGTRPLLPWSGRISIDQSVTLPLLDKLHADQTRYVTRSVANHLNDIAKSDPSRVVETLKRWKKAEEQDEKELDWMIRHSLRTLVKQGHAKALKMLGYRVDPKVKVTGLKWAPASLAPGETLEFYFKLEASTDEKLMIDYVVDFVKANGQTKPKVHKLKQLQLKKGEVVTVSKKHSFRKNASTITYYPGVHTVTLQINGKLFESFTFDLK